MFDIDKLFLATMKYDQGEDESILAYSDVFDNNIGKGSIDKKKAFRQDGVSKGAIQNRLLHDYMTIIADVRNFSLSRASIDVFTSIIQDEVLPSLREQQSDNLAGMSELTPVRQSSIKLEFKTGKEGIGPFALNITNHALTQFIGLTMDYGDNNYHLGDLYKISGEDGRHILGWLSAMVNAHVDVAKDPYIFTLNVNGITYNMTNFLIRAGKGMSTFSFIGQPILKEYCRSLSASGGLYGNNDGRVNVSGSFENKKEAQSKTLILKYYKMLAYKYAQEVKAGKKYTEKDSKGFTFADRVAALKVSDKGVVEVNNAKHLDVVFDSDRMLAAAKDINQNGLNASTESLYLQVLTMQAFNNLEIYADQLSALVLNSRIDTKKFGKDKAEQYNFLNNYEQFRYNHVKGKSVDWYLEGMSKEQRKTVKEKHSKEALDKYFEELFLDYKLKQAISLSRQMLYRQSFTASKTYRPLFFNTMSKLFGQEVINSPEPSIGYRQVMNPKTVQAVSNALSGLFRAKAVEGTNRYQKGLDMQFTGPIDFTFGGDKATADGFVHLLLYGAPTDNDRSRYADILQTFPHMSKPLFQRVSSFLSYISHPMDVQNNLEAATKYLEISDGLVNPETGEIENDFLNYLKPIPPSEHFPQGQLLLQESAFNRSSDRTSPLISAFSDLLNHKSEIVRRLARELAIYAYYTSYGQNSRDAFFDLVPLEFRVQYDQAIKDDLYNEDKIVQHMGSTQTGIDYEQVVDAIVRNYWYDQDIVPTKLESTTIGKTRDAFQVGSDDIGLCRMRLRILDKKSANVYGIIVTNDSYGDYFTVRHGRDSFLYKKVGEIDKYQFIAKPTKTSDYSTTNTTTNVYFIIPKLGRHSGSNHSYELASGSDRASMYEENRLPVQFERGNLMLTLKQWMENPNASQAKKTDNPPMHVAIDEKQNAQFKADVLPIKRSVTIAGKKYPLLQVTTAFIPTSTSEIAGDFSEDINQVYGNNYYNNTGDVRALIQKGDLRQAVINNRDVTFVLNFGDEIESGKVINIPRNATQKQIESAVNKWLKERNITTEKSITIGQIGDNLDISVSKKEVEDFVKRQVALRQSMTDNQAEIDEIETAAREQAEELIKLDKRTRIFGKTIQNLIHTGYTINTMYSTGNVGTEQAFVNAGRLLSDWLDFGQVYMYVPQSYMNVENIRKYEEKMGMYDGEPVLISTKEEAQEVQSTIAAQEQLEETVTQEQKSAQQEQKENVQEISEQKEEALEAVNDIETEIVDIGTIELDDFLNAIGEENVFTSDDSETDKDAMENCKNGGTK